MQIDVEVVSTSRNQLTGGDHGTTCTSMVEQAILACLPHTAVYLDVCRLGDVVGQERGVAEVRGFFLLLASLAPLAHEVGVTAKVEEGGRGVNRPFS